MPPPECWVGIPTLSKGKMQSKCWLTGQATCSSLFSALPPAVDLALSHLLRATLSSPHGPSTCQFSSDSGLSNVQVSQGSLRSSYSSRSCYCAIWQAAGTGTGRDGPVPKGISSAQGGGEEIRRPKQKVALPVPIPSRSSYLGEGLR